MHFIMGISTGVKSSNSATLCMTGMNCVWLLDEVQLQQCTRNQAFLRYSVGDTVLGGVYSTRDRVNSLMLELISLERKEVQPSSQDCD